MKKSYVILIFCAALIACLFFTVVCSAADQGEIYSDLSAAHVHNYEKTVVEPTCLHRGYSQYTCECGYSYKKDMVAATGHTYNAVVTEETCTNRGYTTYTCDCGASYVGNYIPARGHIYTETSIPPTVSGRGYSVFQCDCGLSYQTNFASLTGHVYEPTVIEATCTTEGYTLYQCECGVYYKDAFVPTKNHSFETTVIDPTCSDQGYTVYECVDCGLTNIDDLTQTIPHTYSMRIVSATCEDQGYTAYTCECGHSYISEYVEPTGHTYTQYAFAPTCTESGYTSFFCSCGYAYIDNITPPTDHNYSSATTQPTCTSNGFTEYTCTCGISYVSDIVSATGHNYTENVTAPTCTDLGFTTHTCECGSSYISDYVEPSHNLKAIERIYPTINLTGYTLYECDDCGFTYKGDIMHYSDIVTTVSEGDSSAVVAKGIDVSVWQNKKVNGVYQSLDWAGIKNEGVEFAILRASYGTSKCAVFELNYADAKAAGMPVGAYCYTTATTVEGIKAEANALLSYLDGKQFEYPIYFDLEDEAQKELGEELLMEMCLTFYDILQSNGYYVALYTNHNWLHNILDTDYIYQNLDIWYARYATLDVDHPWAEQTPDKWTWKTSYAPSVGMWQFSCTGKLTSASHATFDMNFCYIDYPTLMKTYGLNGFGEEIPDKTYAWILASSLNVRSEPVFSGTENIIGGLSRGDRVEVIEATDAYTKIWYNGQEAYISAKPEYITFTDPNG